MLRGRCQASWGGVQGSLREGPARSKAAGVAFELLTGSITEESN